MYLYNVYGADLCALAARGWDRPFVWHTSYHQPLEEAIEEQLDFGKEIIDASLSGTEKAADWLGEGTSTDLEQGQAIRAHGGILRELQAIVKAKDPGFGGLIRVRNKQQEFSLLRVVVGAREGTK
jgi:hypothetical protein